MKSSREVSCDCILSPRGFKIRDFLDLQPVVLSVSRQEPSWARGTSA